MAGKDKIVRILQLLEASKKIPKPDRNLYEAWKIALKNQSDQTAEKALQYLLENGKDNNYHVQPDEFVKICRTIIKTEKREKNFQGTEDQDNVYYPPTDQQAKSYGEILAGMKVKKTNKVRHYDVVENYNPQGEMIYYSCHDHVDVGKFIESCVFDFGIRPSQVKHVFFRDRKIPVKDFQGNTDRFKNSFEKSDSGHPVTIGDL